MFSKALRESYTLRKSLDELNPEERLAFIKVFSEALETDDSEKLKTILAQYGGAAFVGGIGSSAIQGSNIYNAALLASGIVSLLLVVSSNVIERKEKDTLKDLIRSAVGA